MSIRMPEPQSELVVYMYASDLYVFRFALCSPDSVAHQVGIGIDDALTVLAYRVA